MDIARSVGCGEDDYSPTASGVREAVGLRLPVRLHARKARNALGAANMSPPHLLLDTTSAKYERDKSATVFAEYKRRIFAGFASPRQEATGQRQGGDKFLARRRTATRHDKTLGIVVSVAYAAGLS